MIFDEIISLFFSIFEGLFVFLFEGVALLFSTIINVFILLIEFVVCLFITDFSIKKVKPYKSKKHQDDYNEYNHQKQENRSFDTSKIGLFAVVIIITAYFLVPKIFAPTYQDITFVAKDGHSLPFASVVIYSNGSVDHKRTKNDGSIRIKKSGLEKVVINDKRYVETTWSVSELDDILVVKRTLLGSGLDILAKKLLQPTE